MLACEEYAVALYPDHRAHKRMEETEGNAIRKADHPSEINPHTKEIHISPVEGVQRNNIAAVPSTKFPKGKQQEFVVGTRRWTVSISE